MDESILLKCVLPKAISRFSAIPTKMPVIFFQRNRTGNPKIYVEKHTHSEQKQCWEEQTGAHIAWFHNVLQNHKN